MTQEQLTLVRKLLEDTEVHGRVKCWLIYEDRVVIHLNGEYFGIMDPIRKTWVD